MKLSSEAFKELISRKKYIFHVHTDYSDGHSSVEDYFRFASRNGFELLIFTEHVRKRPDYDLEMFCREIERTARLFPSVSALKGVEAKILPGGDLDIPEEALGLLDIVCFGFHSFPAERKLYDASFRSVVSDERWKKLVRVWVHPCSFLKRQGRLEEDGLLSGLAETALREGVFIEVNKKHRLPPQWLVPQIPEEFLVEGYDAHSVDELTTLK